MPKIVHDNQWVNLSPEERAIKQGEHIASQLMEAGYSARGAAFALAAAIVCVTSNAPDFKEFLAIKDRVAEVWEGMSWDEDNPHTPQRSN